MSTAAERPEDRTETVEDVEVTEPTAEQTRAEQKTAEQMTAEQTPVDHGSEEQPTVALPTVAEPTLAEPTLAVPTLAEPTLAVPTVPGPTSAPAPTGPAAPVRGSDEPAATSAAASTPLVDARTLRVGTVVWGLVLAVLGVGVLAWAGDRRIDVGLAAILLVAGAGVALLVGSLVTGARQRRRAGLPG
ncbi:hypothetical protein KIN34_08900 [Cellulomonas sp. DKR-3]|uniref:Uncharacterized protein n=1 Tax=Cellulomonas fulva TaxID=2835530 RepID=A0ABS5TZ32_9CELL|nr:hypothetical protein [Cellulomonas fulva]MBT0994402.1 hypothetical protein [Cellulomonas fulva]